MSIAKKRDKSASAVTEKSKGLKPFDAPGVRPNPRVMTAIQFMEDNLQQRIHLTGLADAANLSFISLEYLQD